MSFIEADPGTGILFLGLVTFIILGLFTLSGAWALAIWVVIGLLAAFVIYFVGIRLAKWARGEWSPRSSGSSGPPERDY